MATALLEKQEDMRLEAAETGSGPVPYHWTVDTFCRAVDAGVFKHPKRLELIQGRIIENPPMNPPHASLADIIAEMLRAAVEPSLIVREAKCIHIAFDGEPVPDISVVRGKRTDYRERHPTPDDTALLVEVADTTVAYDTGGKALLYAQAGISDYWVILVGENAILVHREPMPNGYQGVRRCEVTDTISPLAASDVVLAVRDLLSD